MTPRNTLILYWRTEGWTAREIAAGLRWQVSESQINRVCLKYGMDRRKAWLARLRRRLVR